jgi:hypothetical protein
MARVILPHLYILGSALKLLILTAQSIVKFGRCIVKADRVSRGTVPLILKHKYNLGTQILYMYRKLRTYIRMWKVSNNKRTIEMIADKSVILIEYATDIQYYPWRKLCNKKEYTVI